MRIKKHYTGNRYIQTPHGLWVRDFTHPCRPVDINKFTTKEEYSLIMENEIKNNVLQLASIDAEYIQNKDVVILSDGCDFEDLHHILAKFPESVKVIATNRTLAKWKVAKKIDYFVVNNPFKDAMSQLPKHSYFPRCVVSSKTYNQFIKQYMKHGTVYKYTPVHEEVFSPLENTASYQIDDYRNPICAAIGLAHRFGASRLLLLCCDDAFRDERAGAIRLSNGLWMYEQHEVAHGLIEANLHWLLNNEEKQIKIANLSHGPDYKSVPYITKEQALTFFQDDK